MLSRTLLIDRALASEGLVGLRAVEVVAHLGAGPVARHVAPCASTARLHAFAVGTRRTRGAEKHGDRDDRPGGTAVRRRPLQSGRLHAAHRLGRDRAAPPAPLRGSPRRAAHEHRGARAARMEPGTGRRVGCGHVDPRERPRRARRARDATFADIAGPGRGGRPRPKRLRAGRRTRRGARPSRPPSPTAGGGPRPARRRCGSAGASRQQLRPVLLDPRHASTS